MFLYHCFNNLQVVFFNMTPNGGTWCCYHCYRKSAHAFDLAFFQTISLDLRVTIISKICTCVCMILVAYVFFVLNVVPTTVHMFC